MASLRKSLALSNVATFANLFISLGLVIVVSRLLEPAAIGGFLIAYAVIMLIDPIREFELKSFVIVEPDFGLAQMRSVRMVALGTAALGAGLCLAGSAILYASYDTNLPGLCLLILTLTFIVRPMTQPAEALLARQLRYGPLAIVKITAAVIRATVTLALIWQGMGAEALAIGVVAEVVSELLCLAFIDRRMAFARPAKRGLSHVLRFCVQLTGAQLATRLAAALEPLMIGAVQGLAMTAFYNRGNRVVRTFRSGVEQATLPIALQHFASAKGDRDQIRRAYVRAIALLTGLSWPVLGVFIVLADAVILVLFGDQWGQAVPLGQILALGAIVYAASALSHQVHAALGETALLMKRDAGLAMLRLVVLVATVFVSTVAVAWGLVAVIAVSQIVHLKFMHRSIGLTFRETVSAVWKSAAVALACVGAVTAVRYLAGDGTGAVILVIFAAAAAGVTWGACIALSGHPLSQEIRQLTGSSARAHTQTSGL